MANPYIGDPQLEPDEEPEFYCADCDSEFYSICDFESHMEHCDTVPTRANDTEGELV